MIERIPKEQYINDKGISAEYRIISDRVLTHWHDFFEIEFILSGNGTYTIDGEKYDLKENMLFLMTPVNFHDIKNDGNIEIINVMFSENICNKSVLNMLITDISENVIMLSSDDANLIKKLLYELISATIHNDDLYISYIINTLLIKIVKTKTKNKIPKLTYVQKALLYILTNFKDNITLDDVSTHVGLAPAYFSTVFSNEMEFTFKEYLDNIRLDYAQKMLINSEMSVSDVCYESGFHDYSNFIRKFKNHFGISPGKYSKSK